MFTKQIYKMINTTSHKILCTSLHQLAEGKFLSADVVAAVDITGSGGLVLANCWWTDATSLGRIPASRIPDPGPRSRAKTGVVAGLVAGLPVPDIALGAICNWTVSLVGWAADSTYVVGCVPADSFCADTLLSARTNCRLAFNLAVWLSSAGWMAGDTPARQNNTKSTVCIEVVHHTPF